MIGYREAEKIIRNHIRDPGSEHISLELATGRYLAGSIAADRDLPPYDRATMDGIAINTRDIKPVQRDFTLQGMAPAGSPRLRLKRGGHCIEIATGAVVPEGADAVVRYEDLEKTDTGFRICTEVVPGQSIHRAGSDAGKGTPLLEPGTRIGPAEVAVLASVGIDRPFVKKLPVVTLVSSGDELVEVGATPEPHQIRKSNTWALRAALREFGITPGSLHLRDDPEAIRTALDRALRESTVLMLSGGVSRGKFDFIPDVLEALGVQKHFHRVAQRPGKPFWFGSHKKGECLVFSFPGNPVSTFLNYHLYFRDWLIRGFGGHTAQCEAILDTAIRNSTGLTHFRLVQIEERDGMLYARETPMNSSGDFLSLARADGFVRIEPADSEYGRGTKVRLIPFKSILQ